MDWRAFTILAVLAAFVSGCGGPGPALGPQGTYPAGSSPETSESAAQARPTQIEDVRHHVFAIGYHRISDIYVNPVDLSKVALDGLGGLSSIDDGFAVEPHSGNRVRLLVEGQTVALLDAPTDDDATDWARLTANAVSEARDHSRLLAAATAEEIYEAVFTAVTADLDGYSRYSGAQQATDQRNRRDGYGGIGIAFEIDRANFVVTEVIGRSPASRAGILPGDRIIEIEGRAIDAMDPTRASERLRGPIGSDVTITLQADSGTSGRVITLTREQVIPTTVTAWNDDGIGIVRIERFNAATSDSVRDHVGRLINSSRSGVEPRLRGLVLDLRSNPGGLLEQAVKTADLFLPRGRILSTEGRHPDSMQRWDATSDDISGGLPIVALVDGRSASAAEIVAAALQDSERAIVIGAPSFGKGSVQTVTRLPNNGELLLTWSRIYAPSGYTLHQHGVLPNLCTSRDETNATTLIEALERGDRDAPGLLVRWRAEGNGNGTVGSIADVRATCPDRMLTRTTGPDETVASLDTELSIARQLLDSPRLFERTISLSRPVVAQSQ